MAFLLEGHEEEIEYVYPFICGLCGFGSSNIDIFHKHFLKHSDNVPSSVFHQCELENTVYSDTDISLNIGSYCCKTCSHTFPTVCHLLKHLEEDSNTDKYIMDLQTKTAYPLTSQCASVLAHSSENSKYSSNKSINITRKHSPERNGIDARALSRGGKCGPKQITEQRLDLHSFEELLHQVEYQQKVANNINIHSMEYSDDAGAYDDEDNSNVVSLVEETIVAKPQAKGKKRITVKRPGSRRSKRGEWFCCKFCGMSYRKENKKLEHEKEHETVEGNLKYAPEKLCTCELCGCVMLKLKVHLHFCPFKEGQRRPRAKPGEPKKAKDQTIISCPYCSKSMKKYILSHHVRKFHMENEPAMCDTCGKIFKDKYSLSRHGLVHNKNYKIICSKCGKGFHSRAKLRSHMISHDETRNFHCNLCPAKYKFPKNLVGHVERVHAGKKEVFQCEKCSKRYSYRHSLMHHLKYNHDMWASPEQEKAAKERAAEKAARRQKLMKKETVVMKDVMDEERTELEQASQNENVIQTGELADKEMVAENGKVVIKKNVAKKEKIAKYYTCVVCNKVEQTKQELTDHMKTHVNNENSRYPYVCNECPLSYSSLGCLKRHKRNKHGPQGNIKILTCDYCNHLFKNSDALKMHKFRNHNPANNILFCGWKSCRRRFKDKAELEKHRKTHIGAKVYECERCGKTFMTLSGFMYHWRSQHPKIYKLPEAPKEDESTAHVNEDNNRLTANESEVNVQQDVDVTTSFKFDSLDSQQCLEDHSYMNVEKQLEATKLEDFDKAHKGESQIYLCAGCDISFVNRADILQHLIDDHNMQLYDEGVSGTSADFSYSDTTEEKSKTEDLAHVEHTRSIDHTASVVDMTNDCNEIGDIPESITSVEDNEKDKRKATTVSKPKVIRLTKIQDHNAPCKTGNEGRLDLEPNKAYTNKTSINSHQIKLNTEQKTVTVKQNQKSTGQNKVIIEQKNVKGDHVSRVTELLKDNKCKGKVITEQGKVNTGQKVNVVKTLVMRKVDGRDYKELCNPDVSGYNQGDKSLAPYDKQTPKETVKRTVKIILKKI